MLEHFHKDDKWEFFMPVIINEKCTEKNVWKTCGTKGYLIEDCKDCNCHWKFDFDNKEK